ncbi:hypothetical protein PEL8287_03630 [Roseovarius litorisediminis]|uniref:T6SS Phospholipase effector Tle1-like catalytic domain-containing protein n=1 Tax=Roseovarius litorisediminis TaxID=1312363 RepID=A0A1Y5TK43_9RHOB|nr:DUF2235 domain-containing protein [Roseovarius litorisediminis]SLN65810.1 hypothetical protein PEL8287_03630 [Roseovarius litorisediminis]
MARPSKKPVNAKAANKKSPKSIVVCCDGTGNEIKENQSNVLKFYRILERDAAQIAFYHPGVGTISNSGAWEAFKNKAKGVFGLATGYGLDANVLEAYQFVLRNYEEGDDIYLFGFSRGAYTVRMLAGFMHLVGLLERDQEHLCGYALTAYKQASDKDDFTIAWRVQEVLRTRRAPIRFMGCWDTVGSVIIPRRDRMYLPSLQSLPYTRTNPSVKTFRHAMAIDERRRMFRLAEWSEPQKYKPNPFVPDDQAEDQDIGQHWFAGVHADIGGSYPEPESGLAKHPLKWMTDEAASHGLRFRKEMAKRLVEGRNPANSKRKYAKPDANGKLHDSMTWAWKILEYLPKRAKRMEWPERKDVLGFYLPLKEPRRIANDSEIHESVRERQKSGYSPVNLPPQI